MRILLAYQPVDGGVARHVADLFDGLSAAGHELVLCGPSLPSASLLAPTLPPDAPHVRLEMGRLISPAQDLTALRRFAAIVRAVRPEVIHAHSSKAGALARLGKLAHPRIPVLYTPHGYAFEGFFEHELERAVYRTAETGLGVLTDCVIAVCAAEARLAATTRTTRRIEVVHNGVGELPAGSADPAVEALVARGPVVCVITQLRPGKGVETLIDALPSVLARHPDLQVALAGDGPLREALRARARERGVDSALHFLGEHADPIAVLRASRIFLLTSWAESFPYVILEAMAAGIPIVSSDVGGVSEALADRQTGLLVPARDAGATSGALLELLNDPALGERLAAAARARVRERFNLAAMIDGTLRVYRLVAD